MLNLRLIPFVFDGQTPKNRNINSSKLFFDQLLKNTRNLHLILSIANYSCNCRKIVLQIKINQKVQQDKII